MKDGNGQKKVLIKYTRASDFKYIPVTGVVGGATPNGEILGSFFIEHSQHPEQIELTLDEKGRSVKEDEFRSEHQVTREIMIGIMLNPKSARSIGNWLVNWAEKVQTQNPAKT